MVVVLKDSGKGYILHVSSNGMLTIPASVKRELGITADTPLKLEVVGSDKLSLTKMRLIEDSVAAQIWKEYPLKLSRKQIVADVRKVRRELYQKGEQGT